MSSGNAFSWTREKLSSANGFNLDMGEFFSFGKGLRKKGIDKCQTFLVRNLSFCRNIY